MPGFGSIRFFLIYIVLWLVTSVTHAQKIWIKPNPYSLNDSLTIFVDLKQCQNQSLLGKKDLYLWTWQPSSPASPGNSWENSSQAFSMTNEGDYIWSFTMVPTSFYGVDSMVFARNGWWFLVKSKNGGGGGNQPQQKTEDISLLRSSVNLLENPVHFEGGLKMMQYQMIPLNANQAIFPESDRPLDFQDILRKYDQGLFKDPSTLENLRYLEAPFWFTTVVSNPDSISQDYTFLVGTFMTSWNDIEIYMRDKTGRIIKYKTGYGVPKNEKVFQDWRNMFSLTLKGGDSQQIFIRADGLSSHEVFNLSPLLYQINETHLKEAEMDYKFRFSLIFSLLAFVVIYYLLWFLMTKKKELGFYALLWTGFLLTLVIPSPIGYYFAINEVFPIIRNFFDLSVGWLIASTFSLWGILGFSVYYLQLKGFHPRSVKWAVILSVLPVFLFGFAVVNYWFPEWFPQDPQSYTGYFYFPSTILRSFFLAIAFVFAFGMGIYVTWKGFKPARYFLIAFLPLTVAAVLVSLSNVNMAFAGQPIGLPPLYNTINNFSMLLALILFALAMGYRQKSMEKNEKRAQEEIMEAKQKSLQQKLELKEQELALEKEKSKKAHLQELDTLKSKFFANISHELRTPLTLMLAQNQNLREEFERTSANPKFDKIDRNGQRLMELINQMLSLAKLETGKLKLRPDSVKLIPYLKNLLFSFESLAKQKNIRLVFDSEEKDLVCEIDPEKMERVIFNLLSNALHFTPVNGRVSLKLINQHERLEIRVADSGQGIREREIPHIFDRYYSDNQHSTHQGTGIGLALAGELVLLHNGKLSVESEPNKGATFLIEIPYVKPGKTHGIVDYDPKLKPIEEEKPLPVKEINLDANAREVLVVEDNADVSAVLSEQLIRFGYRVREVENGKQGLDQANKHLPDLIITDLMMPEMDGLEFTQAIREDARISHIPIILLTAKASDESKIEGLKAGVDAYLTKPFNAKELKVRVSKLIAQRDQLRERFSNAVNIDPTKVSSIPMDQVFLQKVIETIENQLTDPQFGLTPLSEAMNMSATHLNRKLNALIGQSAGKLIRSLRLNRAAVLISKRTAHVSEIAYQLGFNDPANFSRSFKQRFGVAPSDYKG